MIDNCLNDGAQFRYRDDKRLMLNIKTQGNLISDYQDKEYRRLSIYYPKILDTIKWAINDRNSLKQNPSGSLYFYSSTEKTCIEPGVTDDTVDLTRTRCTDVADEEKKFSFGKEMIIKSIKQFFILRNNYVSFMTDIHTKQTSASRPERSSEAKPTI